MKATNYIVVFGWMINDLKLSGYDLLVYGMIYGYSQDGESWMKCSMKYITSSLNASKSSVQCSLKKLLERELIFKEYVNIGGVQYGQYRVNMKAIEDIPKIGTPIPKTDLPIPKIGTPIPKIGTGGVPKTDPNNTILYNNKDNNKDNIISSTNVEEPKPKKPRKKYPEDVSKFHGECFSIFKSVYSEFLNDEIYWTPAHASATIQLIAKIKSKMGDDASDNEKVKQNFEIFLRAITRNANDWDRIHFTPTYINGQFDSIYIKLKNNGGKQISCGGADISAEYLNNIIKDISS